MPHAAQRHHGGGLSASSSRAARIPGGEGKVPSLRGLIARGKYKDAADLAAAFADGEMMGYEHMSSGGMGEVQSNLSKLPEADRQALAEYIASLR